MTLCHLSLIVLSFLLLALVVLGLCAVVASPDLEPGRRTPDA